MRIMLDTNILISLLFFPNKKTEIFTCKISLENLYLCDYVLRELWLVTERKFPHKRFGLADLLSKLNYSVIHTSTEAPDTNLPSVRDAKDTPILHVAVNNNIDILITGDKDFLCLKNKIARPLILDMTEYLEYKNHD